MKISELITEAKVSIRDQIIADVKKDGGNVNDYYIRFTDVDRLGFSAKQSFGRSPDVDDPNFDVDYIGKGKGRPAVWFYPLNYWLKSTNAYATGKPHVWLVKLKPGAWLQPTTNKTNAIQPAPSGKERVGLLRTTIPPAAIFFEPAWELVGKYYDYGTQHQRHGQVKGAPVQPKQSFVQKVLNKFKKSP